jgi:hypothetical protein
MSIKLLEPFTWETAAARRDFLVELRGFEPLTSAVQTSAPFTAPLLPVLKILVPKAPLDPALERRCFPRPTRGQRLEGLAGLDENC